MSIEDPRVFYEPWCLECLSNSASSCICNETDDTYHPTYDPAHKNEPF